LKTHKDLDVWKISIDFVKEIYQITNKFPKDEIYCLTQQMRRSAISIPSNIAEGASRNSKKEFVQFLYIALGSCSEIETQLIIANELTYCNENNKIFEKIESIRKMLLGLIKHLKRGNDDK